MAVTKERNLTTSRIQLHAKESQRAVGEVCDDGSQMTRPNLPFLSSRSGPQEVVDDASAMLDSVPEPSPCHQVSTPHYLELSVAQPLSPMSQYFDGPSHGSSFHMENEGDAPAFRCQMMQTATVSEAQQKVATAAPLREPGVFAHNGLNAMPLAAGASPEWQVIACHLQPVGPMVIPAMPPAATCMPAAFPPPMGPLQGNGSVSMDVMSKQPVANKLGGADLKPEKKKPSCPAAVFVDLSCLKEKGCPDSIPLASATSHFKHRSGARRSNRS